MKARSTPTGLVWYTNTARLFWDSIWLPWCHLDGPFLNRILSVLEPVIVGKYLTEHEFDLLKKCTYKWNRFSYEWFRTSTCFDTEAERNLASDATGCATKSPVWSTAAI